MEPQTQSADRRPLAHIAAARLPAPAILALAWLLLSVAAVGAGLSGLAGFAGLAGATAGRAAN